MPEVAAVGENDNGVLLREWPELLMSGDLTPTTTDGLFECFDHLWDGRLKG